MSVALTPKYERKQTKKGPNMQQQKKEIPVMEPRE